MAQAEQNQSVFAVMRVYGMKDGNLYLEDRAVVKVAIERAPGTPVRFHADGKDYFGDVIKCFRAEPGSEFIRVLEALSGRNVYVHFPESPEK